MKQGDMRPFTEIAIYSIAPVVSGLLSLAIVPLATHIYEPDQLGRINLFFAITPVLMTIFSLGLDQGYLRFFGTVEDPKKLLAIVSLCTTCFVALVCTLAAVFGNSLNQWIFDDPSAHTAPWIFSSVTSFIVLRILSLEARVRQRPIRYLLFTLQFAVLQKGVYIVSSIWTTNYVDALNFSSAASIIVGIISLAVSRHSFCRISSRDLRDSLPTLLKFSLPLLLSGGLYVLTVNIPNIVVSRALGFDYLSFFTAAVTVASSIQIAQSGINAFWAPFVYRNFKTDIAGIQALQPLFTAIATTLAIVLTAFSQVIFGIFDSRYFEYHALVPLLVSTPLFYTLSEIAGIGTKVYLKPQFEVLASIVFLAAMALSLPLLTEKYGVTGAAYSVLFSNTLYLGLRVFAGQRLLRTARNRYQLISGVLLYFVAVLVSQLDISKHSAWVVYSILLAILVALTLKSTSYFRNNYA